MIAVFILAMVAGFAGMVLASQRAVSSAMELAVGMQIPPFFIGITLLAIGTDLPEIANSIVAAVTGHGDVAVGDSIGSVATQATLVLGLLPILGGAFAVPRRGILATGVFTAAALGIVALLVADGRIGRPDALLLLGIWLVGSRVIYQRTAANQQLVLTEDVGPRFRLVVRTMAALVVVGVSAMLALRGIVGLAEALDAPEFLIGFFVASIGTSLPEMVFDLTAIRRGAVAMAIGDVLGSSFVDSTLSTAIGPLIAPTDVTGDLVARAALAALVAIVIVTVMMTRIDRHDWRTGAILIGIYGAFFVVLL